MIDTSHKSLWESVDAFDIDDEDSAFTFTDRLARENDWPLAYALRAVAEYKKFMFLICIAQHPLTPSDQVDQVWHLHLLYTQSYWHDFCRDTLGRDIHHGPTKGGNSEKAKYKDLYHATKTFYSDTFETHPPVDIWPSSRVRFGELRFTRVNRHRNWVIPKIRLRL